MNYSKDGLSDLEVEKSRKKNGSNVITSTKKNSFFSLLIESLGDPIIRILLIALAIKTIFLIKNFDWYETIGIVIAIFLASFISSISEYGSNKAFEKLQEESSKIKSRVKRNGKIIEISCDDIVVGDIVKLETGDKIPADGYIVEGDVTVDESSINGEAKEKYKEAVNGQVTEKNMVFRGTVVYSKSALMLVTKVGDNTFYGDLAREIQEKSSESPLKLRLRKLASIISKIGYFGAFLVSFSYLFSVVVINNNFNLDLILNTLTNFPLMFGHILYALTLSVTIIVVAVPEGLPMMITLVLSSNMKRMLKDNVLVRKLVGIETVGSLNILFTDKTGTLTKGKLEVIGYVNSDLKRYCSEEEIKKTKLYDLVSKSFAWNNASSYDTASNKAIGGNITDRALRNFMKTYNEIPKKIREIPFDSKLKYSLVSVDKINYIKGAPEVILKNCNKCYDTLGKVKSFNFKTNIYKYIEEKTKEGIRVIALATSNYYKELDPMKNLVFLGLVLIKDEVRKEAVEGIKLVSDAGIQTVMITGDNKDTALSIGKEVGLIKSSNDLVLTSDELKLMNDESVKKIIPNLKIVARSLPNDKSRLVRLSQELDLVVGMTGDGVNDAPALKKADVGFAMGSGTEVSKEASDIVILDDNFLSISKAILFGRTIFKSIRKFIIVQLTINFCAIALSIIGPFIGIDTPITVIQMLWLNMVMDTLAGLAFAYEPPLLEYMKEKPKKKDESIINKYMFGHICVIGLYSALICILFLKLPFVHNFFNNEGEFLTAFFGLFIFIDIFNSFCARTHRLNLLANITKNKVFLGIMLFIVIVQIILIYFGGTLFRTTGLTFMEFQIMILIAASIIPIDFIRKIYLRSKKDYSGV